MEDTSSSDSVARERSPWRLTASILIGAVVAIGLFVVVNGVEQRGWAEPDAGVVASATIVQVERSDRCGVSGKRSRCYRLSLAVQPPIDGPHTLDVNIEDALVHRFAAGTMTRVVALPDGTIALDRTFVGR